MMHLRRFLLPLVLFLGLFLLTGCGERGSSASVSTTPIEMRHATLLRMERADSFVVCEIENPWKRGTLLHRYVLVADTISLPASLPEGTVIRTPLRRAVVFTSVHAQLLSELRVLDKVGGICDRDYIVSHPLLAQIDSFGIENMGAGHQPNIERIMAKKADALLVSPFENATYGGTEKLGIPFIECADYMETDPLARAEWVRFYGMLFGADRLADSLFLSVENHYESLRTAAAKQTRRPTLLVDNIQAGVWYVPGGKSTMGRLFRDAGADYCFDYLPESGSVTLSFETALQKARHADLWLIKYGAGKDLTYSQMAHDFEHYRQFDAWSRHHIYQCNVSHVPFFEEVPFHPDRLLRELVCIFHPSIGKALPKDDMPSRTYFSPMQ